MNLNNNRTNSNNNVGGRDCGAMPETATAETGPRGICCPARSEINQPSLSSSPVDRQAKRPKRIGYLFEKTFTIENLHKAYQVARSGKRNYRTWQRIKFIRKHSMFKFRRYAKRRKINSLVSLIGHAKGTGSASYLRKILEEYDLTDAIPRRSMKWLST